MRWVNPVPDSAVAMALNKGYNLGLDIDEMEAKYPYFNQFVCEFLLKTINCCL